MMAAMRTKLPVLLFLLVTPLLAAPGYTGDAPEISRSRGKPGTVVVLWPRIVPASDDAEIHELAVQVQRRLAEIAAKAMPGAEIDVRPEPERVCPQGGCRGVAVGAVVAHQGGGCVSVATVSEGGESAARLVPWGGQVRLKKEESPFREPPESLVQVTDFAPCGELLDEMATRTTALEKAIADAAR